MYVPNTPDERRAMLQVIGVSSVNDLYADVPRFLPQAKPDLPSGAGEMEVQRLLRSLAGQNHPATRLRSFLGGGAYQHFIPAAVGAIVSRGEFLTAYTPYQAEASQGTLTAIYEFQSMIAELFGLDVANASLYDGASALAESAIVAVRHTHRPKVLVSEAVHPHWRATLQSYVSCQPVTIETVRHRDGLTDLDAMKAACDSQTAAIVFQHPNFFGQLEPAQELCDVAHGCGALAVTCGHPLAFGTLRPPGEFGADVACGEGQPLGLPLSYGGPYLGLLAVRQELVRKIPGRLVGKTVDAEGNPGYILTLQTREQHIRREKATSNICSNQALCTLTATVYLSMLGKEGLREISARNFQNCDALRRRIAESRAARKGRVSFPHRGPWFNEFVIRLDGNVERVLARMREQGVLGGLPLRRWFPQMERDLLVCSTEVHDESDHEAYVKALEASLQ